MLQTRLKNQKGMSYIIAICILGILFAGIVSYNSMLRNERVQMYRTIYSDNALIIAEAAMEILQKIIEDEFSKTAFERKNDLFDYNDLIKPKEKFETVDFDSKKLTNIISNSKPITRIIDIFGGTKYAKINEVRVFIDRDDIHSYEETCGPAAGFKANSREKSGLINYRIEVEYFSVKKVLTVKKQIKIISTLPKGLRYFTLFVKSVPAGTDLNSIMVDEDGDPVQGKPLILENGNFNKEASPLNIGMVFLGNEKPQEPIVLRLSHGADRAGAGELFHLFNDYYFDIIYDRQFPQSPYLIGHLDYGLCREMKGMGGYGIAFQRDVNTSVLKLFGSPSNPSPTRVLGNVRRSYVRLAAYQDKATLGISYMSAMPFATPGSFQSGGTMPIADINEDPLKFKACSAIAARIFSGAADYLKYSKFMNQIVTVEPYNHGLFSEIKDKRGMICDPFKIPDIKEKLYPSKENNYGGVPAAPADSEITIDDLRKLTLDEKYITPYVSYRFKDAADFEKFKKLFIAPDSSPAILNLGLAAYFEGDVTLPAMTIARGGMIVCKKGNITISGDIIADPFQNQILTLIALDGEIIVNADRVDASLIALREGTKFTPLKPLQINGTLAVNSIDFTQLAKVGGKLKFKTAQTVKTDSPFFYYASIQPDVRNWGSNKDDR